ncbi:MAG: hypothetical protein R2864_05705 [Syntrophotaleaceae bacterium]
MLPMDLTLALTEAREGRLGSTIHQVVRFCYNYDSQQNTMCLTCCASPPH